MGAAWCGCWDWPRSSEEQQELPSPCPPECLPIQCPKCSCPEQSPQHVLSQVNKRDCFSSNSFVVEGSVPTMNLQNKKKSYISSQQSAPSLRYTDDKDQLVGQGMKKTKTSSAADHCTLSTQLLLQAAAVVGCQNQIPLTDTRFSRKFPLCLSPPYLEVVFAPLWDKSP